MKFNKQITDKFTDAFEGTGIEFEDEEVESYLTQAWAQFDAVRRTGPDPTTPLPIAVVVAVEVLRPVVEDIFDTGDDTEEPEAPITDVSEPAPSTEPEPEPTIADVSEPASEPIQGNDEDDSEG